MKGFVIILEVIFVKRIIEKALLYDFYGELLTEHQKKIYEDAIYNDMSLSEIADEQGISRQGVHDLIRRCDKILDGYESKLHLVERFLSIKKVVLSMREVAQDQDIDDVTLRDKIRNLSDEIMNEL